MLYIKLVSESIGLERLTEEGMPRSVLPLEYRRQAKKFLIWFR